MVEKVSQADSNNSGLPNIPAVAPTSDTSYIQPVIGKLGFDTEHPDIFGIGSSPDNGVSFHVWASFKGLVLDKDDMEAIWIHGVSDRVKSEVSSATAEIPAIESAANEGVRKAENAIASSKVNSDAITNMKSAVSAVKSDASAAASDAIKNLNDVESATSSAYAALHSSVASNQADITSASKALDGISNSLNQFSASTNQRIDDAQKLIAQNQLSVDSTNKSLAGLATNLSKYAQDAVSQGKTIAELKQNQSDVSATVASVEGSVNQLKVDTSSVKATASDNKSDIANLQITASETSVALKNANSNIAVVSATASSVGAEVQNANSDISTLQATAKGLQGDVQDAKSNIASLQVSASNASVTMQNNKSDIASLKVSADSASVALQNNKLDVAALSATADTLQAGLKNANGEIATLQGTASGLQASVKDNKSNIANLQLSASSASVAIKDANSNAAVATATASQAYVGLQDAKSNIASVQATANGLKGTVANAESDINQVKTDAQGMHEQITNANSQIATINTSVNGLQTSVNSFNSSVGELNKATQANSTAIEQNAKAIALKASQTSVDNLTNSVNSQAASLTVMNNVISTKVSSADVEKAIDGKGYVTKDFVESSITQKANTLSESIAKNDGQIQNITASIDGLQSTVKGKADMSKVTQLADALQFKVTGVYIAQTDLLKLTKNDVASESVLTGPQLNNLASVVKGAKVQLSFDYVTDSDIGFYPILTGAPNEIVGSYPFGAETIHAQKGVKGTYSKTITVNDGWVDSKETNLAFAAFNNGTITFTNLVLKLADSTKGDAQSMFNIMQDQMNLRVTKDNLISQINLSAGNTLIQSNKIFLDADSVVFSKNSKAFIPSAAITNLEADKITTGTLNGVEIRQLETGGRSIDIKNGNIAITSHDPYEPRISFTNDGKNMKMFNALGDLEVINQEFSLFNFTPEDTHSLNPIPFFKVTNTGQIGSGGAQLNMDHAIFDGYEWWTPSAGVTFGRTWNGVDKSSDYADIYAKSFVPHSELSAKTRIKKLDRKEALDKIMQDDMYTYQFKEDVRDGVSKRYASFIIDNVHDVAQYAEPEEFLSANGKGRDDGTQLAYLIAAVQYQQEQIEELKKKLEEK